MTTFHAITNDRSMIDRPEIASRAGLAEPSSELSGRPARRDRVPGRRRLQRQTAGTDRRRPTVTYPWGLAVVVVVTVFLASLIGLGIYAPNGGDHPSLSGPAVAAGVLGMYTTVAGLVLGFIAALRNENAH